MRTGCNFFLMVGLSLVQDVSSPDLGKYITSTFMLTDIIKNTNIDVSLSRFHSVEELGSRDIWSLSLSVRMSIGLKRILDLTKMLGNIIYHELYRVIFFFNPQKKMHPTSLKIVLQYCPWNIATNIFPWKRILWGLLSSTILCVWRPL